MLASDLARLLLVTALALVTLIAFAMTIKPLADGRLSVSDALLFMGLLSLPMVQFALPFAAGFAATLTYQRFASENEAMAAAAGGVPHRSTLLPATLIGLGLSAALGVVAFEVSPAIMRTAERMLVADGARILVAELNRGQSVTLPVGGQDVQLYADRALGPYPDPSASGAREVITLEGVLALRPDPQGDHVYTSARRVDMFLFDDPGTDAGTVVQLVFSGAATNSTGGGSVALDRFDTEPIALPVGLSDDPKHLTWRGMDEALRTPRVMNNVDREARRLAQLLIERRAIDAIATDLRMSGQTALTRASPTGRDELTIAAVDLAFDPVAPSARAIQADSARDLDDEQIARRRLRRQVDRWRLLPETAAPEATVTVVRTRADGVQTVHRAARAFLSIPEPDPSRPTGLVLSLEDVRSTRVDISGDEPTAPPAQRAALSWTNLELPVPDADAERSRPLAELMGEATRALDGATPDVLSHRLEPMVRDLRERLTDLRLEILSKRHERLALASACLVMVLAGAVTGLRSGRRLPLPVYLWSFLPALATVISISAGQRLVHREGPAGLVLLWGGVLALALLTLAMYGRLRRH